MSKYPSFILDTKRIKEIRRECQKSYSKEELFAFLFLRKFSIYISLLLSKLNKVKPNMITILGVITGLLASFYLLDFSSKNLLIGLIFYIITYLLDCVDGELARIKGVYSNKGYWYDTLLRYSLYVANISFTFGITEYYKIPKDFSFILPLIIISTILLNIALTDSNRLSESESEEISDVRKKSFVIDLFVLITSSDISLYSGSLILLITSRYLENISYLLPIFLVGQLLTLILKTTLRLNQELKKFEN